MLLTGIIDTSVWDTILPIVFPALFAAGYWLIGAVQALRLGEGFDFKKTFVTLAIGFIIAFIQGIAGVQIDPSQAAGFAGFEALVIILLSKYAGSAPSPATTTTAVTTTTTTTPPATGANAPPAAIVIPSAVIPTSTDVLPSDDVYDPAKHNGLLAAFVPWESMSTYVNFHVDSDELRAILIGITSPADRNSIVNQITAAETQNLHEYQVNYSTGYMTINYLPVPLNANGKMQYVANIKNNANGGKT